MIDILPVSVRALKAAVDDMVARYTPGDPFGTSEYHIEKIELDDSDESEWKTTITTWDTMSTTGPDQQNIYLMDIPSELMSAMFDAYMYHFHKELAK